MNIPKEIFQNLLLGVHVVKKIAWKWHTTGINNDPVIAAALWNQITQLTTITGKSMLEIGPGRTDALLYMAKKEGAKGVFAIDVYPYLDFKALANSAIEYIIYSGRLMPFDNNSFDFVWSNDTFEHLNHPEITVAELSRILKNEGTALINIDLTDHYSQGKPEAKLFNCLKYPEWIWKLMTSNRSAYVNRIRYSKWIDLFNKNGLEIIHQQTTKSKVITECYSRNKLPYLKKYSETDAVTSYLTVILKKTFNT